MELELSKIYDQLEHIRVELRKLGDVRRQQSIGQSKISVAKVVYEDFKRLIASVSSSDLQEKYFVSELLCDKIEQSYNKILQYKILEGVNSTKMAKQFDIREASSLIPLLDDKEESIERMIAGIELLDSMLSEPNEKKLLISFILKTRLNKIAQLKLKSKYDTATELVDDIKKYMLPKKSANSLLMQLNNITQRDLSINDYGDKIEELFIGLTIAQADGKPEISAVLRPINESLAIKKFTDGLRNRRLSTILAARQYTELKEAVRAAQDEELARPQQEPVVMNMSYRRGFPQPQRYGWRGPSYQSNRGRAYSNSWTPSYARNRGTVPSNNFYRARGSAFGQRGSFRGHRGAQTSRGRRGNGNVYTYTHEPQTTHETPSEETETVQFFRA
jgi:hypothetical protein